MDVVWVEYQGIYRTDTDMDVVWVEYQGKYRTGTDMDVVWVGGVSGYIQDGYGHGCSLGRVSG